MLDLFDADQGRQCTSMAFTDVLRKADVEILMDGRRHSIDNIFVEQPWRSLKYQVIYLHERSNGIDADRVNGNWITYNNTEYPQSSLGGNTPMEMYFGRCL